MFCVPPPLFCARFSATRSAERQRQSTAGANDPPHCALPPQPEAQPVCRQVASHVCKLVGSTGEAAVDGAARSPCSPKGLASQQPTATSVTPHACTPCLSTPPLRGPVGVHAVAVVEALAVGAVGAAGEVAVGSHPLANSHRHRHRVAAHHLRRPLMGPLLRRHHHQSLQRPVLVLARGHHAARGRRCGQVLWKTARPHQACRVQRRSHRNIWRG